MQPLKDKVLYAGCSYTSGSGFGGTIKVPDNKDLYTNCQDAKEIWPNLLHDRFFNRYEKNNIATGGNTNHRIFQETAKELLTGKYKFAFVQWTNLVRHQYEIGFELYSTKQTAKAGVGALTHNLNHGKYHAKDIQRAHDRYLTLEHDQYRIVELLGFIHILCEIAKLKNTQVYFINGLCPWEKDHFTKKKNFMPSDLSDYTRDLLSVDNRDDEEIFELYDKMHNQYQEAGGIHEDKWLILYVSMHQNRVDRAKDKIHPGIMSHKNFVEIFTNKLEGLDRN